MPTREDKIKFIVDMRFKSRGETESQEKLVSRIVESAKQSELFLIASEEDFNRLERMAKEAIDQRDAALKENLTKALLDFYSDTLVDELYNFYNSELGKEMMACQVTVEQPILWEYTQNLVTSIDKVCTEWQESLLQ